MTDSVEVTQADREAAADYWLTRPCDDDFAADEHEHLLQAFARHRIAAEQSRTDAPGDVVEALYMARSWINQHSLHCRSLVAPESEDGPPFDCDCDLPRKLAVIGAGIAALSHPTQEQPRSTDSELADDVVRLVIAAREVAFGGLFGAKDDEQRASIDELDKASEAFASRVPWENEDDA